MYLKRFYPLMAPADDAGAAGGDAEADALARGDVLDGDDGDDGAIDHAAAHDADVAVVAKAAGAKAGKAAAEEGDDGDDGDAARKPAVMIPKARFDDARRKDKERIRALEQELGAAKKPTDTPAPAARVRSLEADAAKLMEDYAKALDVGDTKHATNIMNSVRAIDRQVMQIETSATSANDRAMAVEQVRLDMLIDTLEEKYPQLKEGSDEYDEDLVGEIGELRAAFEARGYSSSDSLKRAMKYALREDGASAAAANRDVDAAAVGADRAASKADKADKAAADRKAEAVRRNLKVAGKTPPDTGKTPGVDSHKIGGGVDLESVGSMSDSDFDALPETTRAKLRGDFYAPSV